MQAGGGGSLPRGWGPPPPKNPPPPPPALRKGGHPGDAPALVLAHDPHPPPAAPRPGGGGHQPPPPAPPPQKAAQPGAPQLHPEVPNNVAFTWSIGEKEKTDHAFARAAKVARIRLVNNRLIPNAIEPRACVAHYVPFNDEITVWMTSQNPHIHRLLM